MKLLNFSQSEKGKDWVQSDFKNSEILCLVRAENLNKLNFI